ncbi:hypothetical protein BD408DRAFT_483604 [Parasitella parasitica]|nr:hypothetical protein BD408DRAFT_483604 [Parasitella parasitica]
MAKKATNSGQTLADIAKKYEDQQDWHNALKTHRKAAAHYGRASSNESNTLARKTLDDLKRSHEEKINILSRKLRQPSDNVFDMKMLEDEISAIQQRGTTGDPFATMQAIKEGEDDEDGADPFNRFWGVVEPMVNRLTQTSSPPPSSPWQQQQPVLYDTSFNEAETNRIQHEMSFINESFFTVPKIFNVNQSNHTLSAQHQTTSLRDQKNDLEQENNELRSQILDIKNEIQRLQQKSVDSTALKSSIIQFKNDVQKQALRILQTQESTVMTRSAMTTGSHLLKNTRHVGTSTAEIMSRIRELEQSNKVLRSQNRKQDALANKYRERWEKLKEGAKKRQPSSTEPAVSPTGITLALLPSSNNSTLLGNLASANPPMTTTSELASPTALLPTSLNEETSQQNLD